MKLLGTCSISKDPNTNKPKLEFAKTLKGKDCVKGIIYWNDGEDKDGKKTYSDTRFVAYEDMVDFIRNNSSRLLYIKESRFINRFNKEKGKKFDELTIFKAEVYQSRDEKQTEAVFNNIEKRMGGRDNIEIDDSIPF